MVGSFDDLDRSSGLAQSQWKLVPGTATIGEDELQKGIAADDFGEDERATKAVLQVSEVNDGMNKIASSSVTMWRFQPPIALPAP